MASLAKSLGLDRLSREDQMTLVLELWELITADGGGPILSEAQKQELQRRAAEDDAAPADVVSWAEVRSHMLDRIKQSR